MLPEPIQSAMFEIARRLDAGGVNFCLGGSGMLRLAGFDVPVGDIDIVVHDSAYPAVAAVFSEHERLQPEEPWRSTWLLRARWPVGEMKVDVDVIGDLGLVIDGRVADFPLVAEAEVAVGDVTVPLAPLRHWYHLYRVHSPHKAQLIAGRLTDDEILRGADELGIGDSFSPTLIVRIGNESYDDTIEQHMSTDQQSSIIEVASPSDVTYDEPGSEIIDHDLLNETLEYIRPALQADGGDLVLLGTAGGKVTLQMVGACGGCPLSTMTLTAGIERILTDRVPGVTEVVSV